MRITVVTGGFDPLHSGHIALFNSAKAYGDYLIVGLNDDEWLANKKGKAFMPLKERLAIVSNLRMIDKALSFKNNKNGDASDFLLRLTREYPLDDITFCNGGDRKKGNTPETKVKGISHAYGIGGEDKKNSSSWIIKEALALDSETRQWGRFNNFFLDKEVKVKEIIVDAGKSLSYQRHQHRAELWFVTKGSCKVNHEDGFELLYKFDKYLVEEKAWHQLVNNTEEPCHIIEIQYGSETSEIDIERRQ